MAIERQDEAAATTSTCCAWSPRKWRRYYILKANNPAYEDLPATDEMRTLARLKAVSIRWTWSSGRASIARTDSGAIRRDLQPGNWNVGHVVLNDKKVHVLLVT
jgi:hypothetical protein